VNETRVAAGLIFNDQGQVLLAQRAEPDFLKGLWEFPGGKIEDGESPESTLHREIQEELELKIKIDFLIGEFTDTYQNRTVRILAFKALALTTNFLVKDHLDVRWVNPSDIAKYDLVPADKPIFPALISLKK
jgi:8-oxo-dGTP diphosphatase